MGLQLANEATDDGGWYKVETETFIMCVKTLREGVLRHTPSTFNLAGLTVRLCKTDQQSWLHIASPLIDQLVADECKDATPEPAAYAAKKKAVIARYLDRPLFATLRLSIEYTLPDTAIAETCPAPAGATASNPRAR